MAGPQMQWEGERQRTEGQGLVKGERWRHFEIEECMQQRHAMPNVSLLLITPPHPPPYPNPRLVLSLSSLRLLLSSLFSLPSSPSFPASFPPRRGLHQTGSLLGEGEGFPRWRMPWAALLVECGYWSIDKLTPAHGLYGWYQATDLWQRCCNACNNQSLPHTLFYVFLPILEEAQAKGAWEENYIIKVRRLLPVLLDI